MGHEEEWSRLFAGGGEAYARKLASQLESGEREFSPRFESAMGEMILRESSRRGKKTADGGQSWRFCGPPGWPWSAWPALGLAPCGWRLSASL